MSTPDEKKEKDALQSNIGEWLASGFTDAQIVAELQAQAGLDEKEAQTALKDIYTHWQRTRDAIDLREADLIAWHVFLRKKILQKMMAREEPSALRVALAVLDSLATVQGVATTATQVVPLQIVLSEKNDDAKSEDTADQPQG